MTLVETRVDYRSAPKDYDEFFRMYNSYVVSLVRRAGIEENSVEDVASSILLRIMEKDYLSEFDPTLVFIYNGSERPARFKSFLSKIVLLYVRSYRDRQRSRIKHELLIDSKMGGFWRNNWPKTTQTADDWFDFFGPAGSDAEEEVVDDLTEHELVTDIRNYLAKIPRRSVHDLCDLVAVFDAVVVQVRDRGHVDVSKLKDQFGVSHTSMHTWLWWLRENLAFYLGCPVPPKRPRTVRK